MEKEILFCGKCCDKPLYVAGSYLPFVHKWTNGRTPYILEGGAFWDNCCANVNLVLQETVGQYLNLTDCKGRKIYDNALLGRAAPRSNGRSRANFTGCIWPPNLIG